MVNAEEEVGPIYCDPATSQNDSVSLSSFKVTHSIFSANVPRLCLLFESESLVGNGEKFVLRVDVSVADQTDAGIFETARIIREICERDQRIPIYVCFMKKWATDRNVSDSLKGFCTSRARKC